MDVTIKPNGDVYLYGIETQRLGNMHFDDLDWPRLEARLLRNPHLQSVLGSSGLRKRRGLRALDASGTLPTAHAIHSVRRTIMLHTHVLPVVAVVAVFWVRGW